MLDEKRVKTLNKHNKIWLKELNPYIFKSLKTKMHQSFKNELILISINIKRLKTYLILIFI